MVTTVQKNQLSSTIEKQIAGVFEETQDKPTKGYWYVQMPMPGVRYYSFEPAEPIKATTIKRPTQ
jgi:hypothetical protein